MSLQGHKSERGTATRLVAGNPLGGGLSSSNPRVQKLIDAGPKRGTIALVLAGVVVGMIIAYVALPTEFTGASPRHMSQQAIQQWARMVAVGHSEAIHYDDSNALLVLRQIPNPQAVVEGLAASASVPAAERAALEALTEINGFADLAGSPAPQDPGVVGSSLQIVLALAAVALALPILTIALRSVYDERAGTSPAKNEPAAADAPARSQVSPSKSPASQPYQAHSEAPAAPWIEDETDKSGAIHPQFGAPVMHTVSSYAKGQNYDDSFAIETGPDQGNQFLGECGISVATRVGAELQSVEFWAFDMASQVTATKVFAAPAALSDPALIAAVSNRVSDPAADIIAAEPGARLIVDGSAIQIQAEVKSVVCNYGGGTPNSGIESLQIELQAWRKQSQSASVAAAGYPAPANSPFNEYADLQLTPPAQTVSPAPPPSTGGVSPASATQKAKRPEDEDDDPFGGTGNFMPYS